MNNFCGSVSNAGLRDMFHFVSHEHLHLTPSPHHPYLTGLHLGNRHALKRKSDCLRSEIRFKSTIHKHMRNSINSQNNRLTPSLCSLRAAFRQRFAQPGRVSLRFLLRGPFETRNPLFSCSDRSEIGSPLRPTLC